MSLINLSTLGDAGGQLFKHGAVLCGVWSMFFPDPIRRRGFRLTGDCKVGTGVSVLISQWLGPDPGRVPPLPCDGWLDGQN